MPLRTLDLGELELRADAGGNGRTISGYALHWRDRTRPGSVKEYPGMREGFDRGAFAEFIAKRAGRPLPLLDTHYDAGGKTIGGVVFTEDDIGLRFDGELTDTDRAREYAAGVAAGSNSVSLEFAPGETRREGRDTVLHTRVQLVGAVAGVPYGAYEGATVAVRSDEMAEETVETPTTIAGIPAVIQAGPVPLTREETQELARRTAEDVGRAFMEQIASNVGGRAPDQYAAYKSLGELYLAARDGSIPNRYIMDLAERALDDVVTTAGANAALLTGNLTVRNVAGIVSRGRPAITAFGGPRGLGDTAGLSVTWPYFDGTLTDFVGAQSAQKAEITGAPVDIKLGTEALVTYAGGADIAYQLILRGDPSILDIFAQIMLTAWGVVTDAAFVTELETGTVTSDIGALAAVTFASLVTNIGTTSIAVETATGAPAQFILASSTAFAKYLDLIAAADTGLVVSGGASLLGMTLNIGGLPIIHVPSITAGKHIISNRLAAAWHEVGPFQASAEDVAKLGRNVAYWSLGAGARYIPAGIIEVYDVP